MSFFVTNTDIDYFCWLYEIYEYIRPFYEADCIGIIQNLISSNAHNIFYSGCSIKIKMIEVISILLVVGIRGRNYRELLISHVMTNKRLCKSGFSSSRNSCEKYSITRYKREEMIIDVSESNIHNIDSKFIVKYRIFSRKYFLVSRRVLLENLLTFP